MQQRLAVIIFVRLPVPGRCKTRLARSVGDQKAADLYKLCAEHAIRVCAA